MNPFTSGAAHQRSRLRHGNVTMPAYLLVHVRYDDHEYHLVAFN